MPLFIKANIYYMLGTSAVVAVYIRETDDADLNDVLRVEGAAFEGGQEVEFTRRLLADPSAKPLLSLMAFIDDQPAGHILFTAARLVNSSREVAVSFLAPLAVVPMFQKRVSVAASSMRAWSVCRGRVWIWCLWWDIRSIIRVTVLVRQANLASRLLIPCLQNKLTRGWFMRCAQTCLARSRAKWSAATR